MDHESILHPVYEPEIPVIGERDLPVVVHFPGQAVGAVYVRSNLEKNPPHVTLQIPAEICGKGKGAAERCYRYLHPAMCLPRPVEPESLPACLGRKEFAVEGNPLPWQEKDIHLAVDQYMHMWDL